MNLSPLLSLVRRTLHTSVSVCAWGGKNNDPERFLKYNEKVYPPQESHEEQRPAFICHQKCNIKYSPDNMWYIACFVRGMTVDEAIKQLSFVLKKGAPIVKQTILEAQELAVKEHNVEFKSNLWIAESFSTKGIVIKGIRRHAKKRVGEVRYKYCHYFVRLEEGIPPENYYMEDRRTPDELLDDWYQKMRNRKILSSL